MEREQNRYVDRKCMDEWIGVLVIVLEREGRDKDVCLFLLLCTLACKEVSGAYYSFVCVSSPVYMDTLIRFGLYVNGLNRFRNQLNQVVGF